MAIGIALAAEEHGKIVSVRHLCNAAKSYLPTHGTFHKIAHCALCILPTQSARSAPRQSDSLRGIANRLQNAIRKECAEAKVACLKYSKSGEERNPQGVRRGKAKSEFMVGFSKRTQLARSAPRQSGHVPVS